MFEGVQVFELELYQYVFAFKTMIISMHTPFNIGFIFDAAQETVWLLGGGRVATRGFWVLTSPFCCKRQK